MSRPRPRSRPSPPEYSRSPRAGGRPPAGRARYPHGTTHVSVVEPMGSELTREVIVHAILDRSSTGGRLSALSYAGASVEPKVREATVLSMRSDPNLAFRLKALELLSDHLDQPDGFLKTMGGSVTFENVVGDVRGSSMGGNVRYKNVRSRGGRVVSPERTGGGVDDAVPDTVQISTMGGEVKVEEAPEGADLHTMGGNIQVRGARRFVRAKTMGGSIDIDSIDGWVQATTMGGNIEVHVTGQGGEVDLTSMAGDIELAVPAGFGMDLDLEIAFTRNSGKEFKITAPGGLKQSVTSDWDHDHGTPRKYIRMSGVVNDGGHAVKVRTVNGNVTVREGL